MNDRIEPALLQRACSIFFDAQSGDRFLHASMTQEDLAARFRSRALEMHPDRAGVIGKSPEVLEQDFKRLHAAYRLLSRALEEGLGWKRPARNGSGAPMTSAARPATQRTRTASYGTGRFHSGRIPEMELRFAQYLYYRGLIDWRTMIDAVTWQYRVRPKVGEIGRSYRFLDFPTVSRVLRDSPRDERFGDTALRLGVMTQRQLNVVLGKQYQLNYPIGRFFYENGLLSRAEVEHLIGQNRRHNAIVRNA